MTSRPTVLCPTDFSDASRSALRYAQLVAEYVKGRLLVMSVEDPLLTEAANLAAGASWDPQGTRRELAEFAGRVLQDMASRGVALDYEVAVGKPAEQILRIAKEQRCDLIVMSTHGLTGMRKLFFGSTTERVLRETTVPVLATPATEEGPRAMADAVRVVRRILVPVDLSPASADQVRLASRVAEALQVPMIVTNVVEPVRTPLAAKLHLPGVELERRTRAEDALNELVEHVGGQSKVEALVAYGEPSEEIAKIARDRQAGLVVIGLHGSPLLGPRMGSVTYRVLCLTHALVVALPPGVNR
jgi:nucleotide-binding universal stress UspA family protein